MNNLGDESLDFVEADILELIGNSFPAEMPRNSFSFPTLPNQFMGFSLPIVDWTIGVIEPFETDIEPIEVDDIERPEELDDEETVVLGSGIENDSDSLSIANEDLEDDYDLDYDEWDYNDFDY